MSYGFTAKNVQKWVVKNDRTVTFEIVAEISDKVICDMLKALENASYVKTVKVTAERQVQTVWSWDMIR